MPFGEENIISLPLFFCHTKCYTRHNESPQFCPVFHAFGSPAKPRLKGNMYMENEYIIEMLNITKEFPGIKANDNITLQLKKGEIHALLGENGAGKSTLMSILFGLYQPTSGIIKKNGQEVHINTPNDANDLNIGMVHQHFKLVECFSVLDNIILGVEPTKGLFLEKKNARAKVMELSEKYGLMVDPDALISDITVGMQQRTEILKMLYRDNEVLIFDEPTAVLTPQEIDELMKIMKNLAKEGKSILFITHKLNEIMEVADRCTILRKGKAWQQDVLIMKLNEQIRGWTNYHQSVCASDAFAHLDYVLYELLWRWAKRRHPKKNKRWISTRYWHRVGNRNWVFSTENKELIRVDSTAIVRHTKIKATANPFLDEAYFQKRKFDKGMHRLTGKFRMIWKSQNGLCYHCGMPMDVTEEREIFYLAPKAKAGVEDVRNMRYVHCTCQRIYAENRLKK